MNESSRFLKACRGKPVDRIPVWVMRQAGRYLPEYRRLREKFPFLAICKTPELAAEATLQPIQRFRMDAAILFSDILLILEAMGTQLHFETDHGPRIGRSKDLSEMVHALAIPDPEKDLGFVMETIRQLRSSLDENTALIGFSGAPFTLATYLIEQGTSRSFAQTKRFMSRQPLVFHRLMERLTAAVQPYLRAQVSAGAQALQLFDTWAGILSPSDYTTFVLPYMVHLVDGIRAEQVPVIHYSLGGATLLREMNRMGADVMGLDWRIDIGEARKILGKSRPVQGNMDPFALFQPADKLGATVRGILQKGSKSPGYIFNLGHGIDQATPVESVDQMIETIRDFDVRSSQIPRPPAGICQCGRTGALSVSEQACDERTGDRT